MRKLSLLTFLLVFIQIHCQTEPIITSWWSSKGTAYANIPANVTRLQYSTSSVYVSTNSIPSYAIGPWAANPNLPRAKNFVFRLSRNPRSQTGTKVPVGLGPIGLLVNGVAIFNADDGRSYNNQGFWRRNALIWEGVSFDVCRGHPAPDGCYHTHVLPKCLYNYRDSSRHSPLIGYLIDGYPVYGSYGYSNPLDPTSEVKLIKSSYRLRNIQKRDSYANGTLLSPLQYGPDVSTSYPLGSFIEDYEYVFGLGDLDEHNGRFSKTPEYPDGIYAYFMTADSNGDAIYPFAVGPTYYGTPIRPNGNVLVTEPVTTYF